MDAPQTFLAAISPVYLKRSPGIPLENPDQSLLPRLFREEGWRFGLILGALCGVAYYPALNNGFISDDFIMLEWLREWRADFSFLLKQAPDVFRLTSYLLLATLKSAFGYRYEFYYTFSIILHFANCVLLMKLVSRLTRRPGIAKLAAALFAVVQKPQEAIMWLAAAADLLSGICVLASLLMWLRGRHFVSALAYFVGLFSKESAVIVLLLVPLMDWWIQRRISLRREYFYLTVPTIIFAMVFVGTLPSNHMVYMGLYSTGLHSLRVLAKSLWRLAFPSLLLLLGLFLTRFRKLPPREVLLGLVWMTVSLLPFIFLTYQDHVPSRQEYLACMGLVFALAFLLTDIHSKKTVGLFLVMFIVGNVGYLWLVKDRQFERRAAPTTRLLEKLRQLHPQRVILRDFPLNPWMAKMSTRMVAGWQPEMIDVGAPKGACPECPRIRWNGEKESYLVTMPQIPNATDR